jgi:hypothetical protein
LILVVLSFLLVAFIYGSSFKFDVFGEVEKSDIDCIPEKGNNIVHCCYREYESETGDTVAIYCATCYDDGIGNLACDAYDKVYSIKPPDDSGVPPKDKGLSGLLDENQPTIQPDDSGVPPKDNPSLTEETQSPIIEDSSGVNIQKDSGEEDAKEE